MSVPVDVKRQEAAARTWHYCHDLGDGVVTTPWYDWLSSWHPLRRDIIFGEIAKVLGPSLAGMRCLDIACNSGFWSFEAVERGAESVLAFDTQENWVDNARFVCRCRPDRHEYGRIDFHHSDLFNMNLPEAGFDLVFCLGLMYHLTDVFGAAQQVYRTTRRVAVIDTSVSDLPGCLLELPPPGKYFFNGPEEFAFVPTRDMMLAIMKKAGFSRVTPWQPVDGQPGYQEYGPGGFRQLIICER